MTPLSVIRYRYRGQTLLVRLLDYLQGKKKAWKKSLLFPGFEYFRHSSKKPEPLGNYRIMCKID